MAIGNCMAQLAHASIEAGAAFKQPDDTPYAYIMGVENENSLLEVSERLSTRGIAYKLFFEPDFPRGYTALVTEPLENNQRKIFKKYNLY